MANGDQGDHPLVKVTVQTPAGSKVIDIPCKANEQANQIGGMVIGIVEAVQAAYE